MPKGPIRFTLSVSVSAVRLRDHPGSSLKTPTETLVNIPAGAVVELEAADAKSGLVNVVWKGEVFSAFYEDLLDSRV